MKSAFLIILSVFILNSCNNSDEDPGHEYEFVTEYTATVTVGGFVGTEDRTFKIGEIYNGTDQGGNTINIRIAGHSERNEDCPNSWCYQEFLDVPKEYLRLRE